MMISRRVPTRRVHSRCLIQILDHRPCGGALAGTLACHTFRQSPLDYDGRFRAPSRIRPGRRRCPGTGLYRIADQHRRRRRILRPVCIPCRLPHCLFPDWVTRHLPAAIDLCSPILPNRSCIRVHGQGIWPGCVQSPRKGMVTRNTRSTGNTGRNARTGRNTAQHLLDPIHLSQHAVHQHGFGLLGQARRFAYGRTLLQQRNMVQRCLRLRHRQRQQVDHALQTQRLLLHVRLEITTRTFLRCTYAGTPGESTLYAARTRHRHTVCRACSRLGRAIHQKMTVGIQRCSGRACTLVDIANTQPGRIPILRRQFDQRREDAQRLDILAFSVMPFRFIVELLQHLRRQPVLIQGHARTCQ